MPDRPDNFASKKVQDVYVLGDAAIAVEMPKSAFSANSQAKVVAADILAELAKKERFPARYRNTCWSLLAPDDDVKIGANYAPKDGKLDPSGGVRVAAGRGRRRAQAELPARASAGMPAITADMFAKRRAGSARARPETG